MSAGLKNLDTAKLPALPRMADFCLWVTAAEPCLPWAQGSFINAYLRNREEAEEMSLESDAVAAAVRKLLAEITGWSGKPSELYEALEKHVPENVKKTKAWPKAPHRLSNRLKRAATFLRAVGLEIEFSKSGNRKITITPIKGGNDSKLLDAPDASQNSSVHIRADNHGALGGMGAMDATLSPLGEKVEELICEHLGCLKEIEL